MSSETKIVGYLVIFSFAIVLYISFANVITILNPSLKGIMPLPVSEVDPIQGQVTYIVAVINRLANDSNLSIQGASIVLVTRELLLIVVP